MDRPRLLDLFSGAGGCAGYYRAGFDVTGVDIVAQPRYPFEFVQGDALEYLEAHWREFDVIHASPPCQAYSVLRHLPWIKSREYWDFIPPTLEALRAVDRPWILENVMGAPMDGITLCGTMFGLQWPDGLPIYRHRLFQTSPDLFLLAPGHPRHYITITDPDAVSPIGSRLKRGFGLSQGRVIGGHNSAVNKLAGGPLEVDWMSPAETTQAIPPAYTRYIGQEILLRLPTKVAPAEERVGLWP